MKLTFQKNRDHRNHHDNSTIEMEIDITTLEEAQEYFDSFLRCCGFQWEEEPDACVDISNDSDGFYAESELDAENIEADDAECELHEQKHQAKYSDRGYCLVCLRRVEDCECC